MENVLICRKVPEDVKEFLESFSNCEYCETQKISRSDLLTRLKGKSAVLIKETLVDRDFFESAPDLQAVCNISAGYNNVDMKEARKRGIIITNTPGVLNDTVADLIFGLILSSSRRITELDSFVRKGLWRTADYGSLYGMNVHHKTLGIIGMGGIGEAVAVRAAKGFSMNVCYNNRNRKPDAEKNLGVTYRNLDDLFKESDFIVMMTPLNENTRGMIGKREFSLMKKSAFFINASRGQTIDETALIDALKNKRIAGAGLDVFETEPILSDNPLLTLDNVVLTPHIGSAIEETEDGMAMLAAKNLKAILSDGKALTPV